MKLFIREHIPLILIQIIQLFLVLLVYWLDGYRNLPTALYSTFIGLLLLTAYLVYRYVSHRRFYRRLSGSLATLDESLQTSGQSPLARALDDLLNSQYRHYKEQLKIWETKRRDHITFMNQWVHQMKTPLSVIHLTVQGEDDPRYASIREEAERIDKGLETVLYAARLEAFEHDFAVEPVPLRKAVERVIHENKRSFIRNHVYPDVQVDEMLFVDSDAKWLHFMLNQLLSNAIKYSSGSQQKILFSSQVEGREARLTVRDYGVGIPASDLKRVFQPFYTGENGRKFRESTGMGLYLVKEICIRLGHRVEIESKVGEGTAVTLIFTSHERRLASAQHPTGSALTSR
jgi:signal transduction histidine kinase